MGAIASSCDHFIEYNWYERVPEENAVKMVPLTTILGAGLGRSVGWRVGDGGYFSGGWRCAKLKAILEKRGGRWSKQNAQRSCHVPRKDIMPNSPCMEAIVSLILSFHHYQPTYTLHFCTLCGKRHSPRESMKRYTHTFHWRTHGIGMGQFQFTHGHTSFRRPYTATFRRLT